MEADVALRAGAGETWSMPPTGQAQADGAPGRGRKTKAKGRGLPQPVTSQSPQQRSRRKQQQQQQQQQLRLSRSLDDELDAVAAAESAKLNKSQGRQGSISSSRECLLDSDIADALVISAAAATPRRGSAPGQQSTGPASKPQSLTPKEQKKSSSRNRRRRAAAAARKQEIGELEGGEGMAQGLLSPDGPGPSLYLDNPQAGRGSLLPEPGNRKQERRQPSMDSLTGRGPRKHSQQSDDGFFSYETEYGLDTEEQRLKTPDSPQVSLAEARLLKEQCGQVQGHSNLPRAGFGYQGNGAEGNGRGRRRDKAGGVGRMVPKPTGPNDVTPSETAGLGPGDWNVTERIILSDEHDFDSLALSDAKCRLTKDIKQHSTQAQSLADSQYVKSQSRAGIPSDQMYTARDLSALPPRGPTTISPSSSSGGAAVSTTDKSGSLVILEVKDRPGMYYKSSVRTVSDAPDVVPGDASTSGDPAIFASSASPRFHPQLQPMSPYQSMTAPPLSMGSPRPVAPAPSMPLSHTIGPPHAMLPPHSMLPPNSAVPPLLDQFYSYPGYLPVSNLPHQGYPLAQHSVTPTRLTYSPHLNQSPVMSPQQQVFTPTKGTPLDLSFSPRGTPTAHSAPFATHPMSQVQPAPAHCPQPTHSRSAMSLHGPPPSLQSKVPGLRRPNLSALQHTVSADSPLDLSVKKPGPPSNVASSTGVNAEVKASGGAKKLSPETPPPLDLRTNVPTASNTIPSTDTSWAPNGNTAATTITEQPVSLSRELIYASKPPPPQGAAIINEPYTSATTSQPDLKNRPVDRQPVSLAKNGSMSTTDNSSALPEPDKSEETAIPFKPTLSSMEVPFPASPSDVSTAAPLPSSAGQPHVESETAGFLNKSEFLQQRAGIKHDDIVVGPRRPISTLLTAAKLSDPSNASQSSYNTFPPSHSKPGAAPPEHDQKPKDFVSPEEQTSVSTGTNGADPKLNKTSSTQAQDKPTATNSAPSGGSQTIPRRIPRKIEPDSPQNPRRKAGGSRLPKPMNAHSPDRGLPADGKLSLAPLQHDDNEDTADSLKRPLLADSGLDIAKLPKGTPLSLESNQASKTSQRRGSPGSQSDTRSSTKSKSHSPPSDVPNGDGNTAGDSSSHPGKSRQSKASGKSGLPQAVTNTPPSKRKETASKLHMLSNIPVPMSHDPRPKHAPPQKKQQSVEEDEEEEASDKTPLLSRPLASDPGVDNGHVKDESAENQQNCSVSKSSPQSAMSKPSFATNDSSSPSNSILSSASLHSNGSKFDRKQEASSEEVGLKTIPEQDSLDHGDTLSQNSPIREGHNNEKIPSSAERNGNGDNSAKDQSEPPSPCHGAADVINKLRLHRSAEHLGGQAKLSVFQAEDEFVTPTSAARTEVAASVPSSPGHHGDILKVGSCPNTSSASALLDSSIEIEKSPPIVKKKTNLPRIGILRRGSDRTAEICRRASERGGGMMAGIPLSSRRHDPSVEDLKRATSIGELCQSVASLLNIDNEKAAAMITGDLSTRQDLVDGLDADAIIDYLCHHGVLDTSALPDIDSKGSYSERNRALLQQVEGRGTTAVALFVNALRQSGQLHLASSLDTEKRIQPSTSGGYFGKGRHKGEVTVRIEVEFLKILAPRELRPDNVVDASLLNDQLDGAVVKDDTSDDEVKPRCWCFCLSSRRSKTKGRKKKMPSTSPPGNNSMERDLGENGRQGKGKKQHKKSKERSKGKKPSSSASSVKKDVQYQSAKYTLEDPTRDQMDGNSRTFEHQSGDTGRLSYNQEQQNKVNDPSTPANNTVNGKHSSNPSASKNNKKDKSRHDPIIMEFDPKLELVKLRAGQDELASPTRQHKSSPQHFPGGPEASAGMLVEQWKSSGPHFQRKAAQLCVSLVQSARDDLVRYFEQDRSTLVLDVVQEGSSVLVIIICMQASQVKSLKDDVAAAEDEDKIGNGGAAHNGIRPGKKKQKSVLDEEEEEEVGLLDRLQSILFSEVDIRDFDIRGIKLHLALNSQEVDAALSELS